jgi:hypothetical protein
VDWYCLERTCSLMLLFQIVQWRQWHTSLRNRARYTWLTYLFQFASNHRCYTTTLLWRSSFRHRQIQFGLSFVALEAGKMCGRCTKGTSLIFYCERVDTSDRVGRHLLLYAIKLSPYYWASLCLSSHPTMKSHITINWQWRRAGGGAV